MLNQDINNLTNNNNKPLNNVTHQFAPILRGEYLIYTQGDCLINSFTIAEGAEQYLNYYRKISNLKPNNHSETVTASYF